MSAIRHIDPLHARRLFITKQHLDADQRPSMLDVIRDLGCLQLDPIRKVERPHNLILWSRLGNYDLEDLEKLRWKDKVLFEYWAHAASLVLTEDYPIHAAYMRENREEGGWQRWIEKNNLQELRLQMLARLQEDGVLGTSDFEGHELDYATPTVWYSGRMVNFMMDCLWTRGEVLVAERNGNHRKWDVAERVLPDWTPREELGKEEATYRAIQKAVRTLGVAKGRKDINMAYTRNRYWHYAKVSKQLLADGKLIPVQVGNFKGDWMMHVDDLPLLEKIEAGDWQGKTAFLSPFDSLICNRDRTELFWDFYYRIEIYVPAKKRQFGYYVLPILHGDKLIGRMDMEMNRKSNTLHVLSTYAEKEANTSEVNPIRETLGQFAKWLGAENIEFGETMPPVWKGIQS